MSNTVTIIDAFVVVLRSSTRAVYYTVNAVHYTSYTMYLRKDFSALYYSMVLLVLAVACLLPTSSSMSSDASSTRMRKGNTSSVLVALSTNRSADGDSPDSVDSSAGDSESGEHGSMADVDFSGKSGSGEAASTTNPQSHQEPASSSDGIPVSSFPPFYFPPIIDCAPIALEESEFTYVDENEVLFREEVVAVIFWTASGSPVVCSNFEQNGTIFVNITTNSTTFQLLYVFPKGFAIASYVGCSLSVAGSFFLLITYSLFKDLRTLPSLLLMSLSLSFLVGDLLILLGSSRASLSLVQSRAPCVAVAILLHFFFLARFCWTNMIAFEMVRTFTAAVKLMPVLSSRSKSTLFAIYSLIGWGIPLMIILLCVIINFTSDDLIGYGVETCWINDINSALVAFVAPLALSLLFNLVSFIWIVANLCKSSAVKNRTGKQNQLSIRLYVAVFSVMGLTWIFGFIAILARNTWAWYPFIILNSTQALVVSLSFVCTKKIMRYYIELLCGSVPLSSVVSGNKSTASNKISPTTAATRSATAT